MSTKSKASLEFLNELHNAVAVALLARVRSGEATAADLSAAAKFLKDNHIEQALVPGTAMALLHDITANLPYPSEGIPFEHQ